MNRANGMPDWLCTARRAAPWALPLALLVFQGCATAPAPAPAPPVAMAAKAEPPADSPGETAIVEPAPSEAASVDKLSGQRLEQAALTALTIVKALPAVPTVAPHLQAELESALALLKAGQHEQAAEAFTKLAQALPDNPIPAINLALAYKKLDKLDLAETQLKAALNIEPDNPVAGNELALLFRTTGRFADARALYEKTLAKYPHFAMAHKNLGVLCDLYLRDYACAIEHYKSYASSAPNDKSVGIWIADLQKRSGIKESQ
jgi:tetratricopeptide (TPR) repeat protein